MFNNQEALGPLAAFSDLPLIQFTSNISQLEDDAKLSLVANLLIMTRLFDSFPASADILRDNRLLDLVLAHPLATEIISSWVNAGVFLATEENADLYAILKSYCGSCAALASFVVQNLALLKPLIEQNNLALLAIENRDEQTLRALKPIINIDSVYGANGDSLLHIAFDTGYVPCIAFLLQDMRANLKQTNMLHQYSFQRGTTARSFMTYTIAWHLRANALKEIVMADDCELLKSLVESKITTPIPGYQIESLLDVAKDNKSKGCISYLEELNTKLTPGRSKFVI